MFEYELERSTGTNLRLLTHYDSHEVFRLIDSDREHLGKFLSWVDETRTVEDTDNFITNCLLQLTTGTGFVTGISVMRQLVGVIGFQPVDFANLTVDLGYWIHTNFEGNGLVTKAATAMTTIAFTRMGLEKVTITAANANRRSRAVPERLGFTLVGTDAELPPDEMLTYEMKRSSWLGIDAPKEVQGKRTA